MKNSPKEVVQTLGTGVAQPTAEEIKKSTPPKEPSFLKDKKGNTVWKDTPSLQNQLATHPNTTRLGPVVCYVYNLDVRKDLEAYNELLVKAHPVGAPKLQVSERTEFSRDGQFKVLCKTRSVLYMQLAPKEV